MTLVVCALLGELPGFTVPAGVRVVATGIGPVEAAAAVARELAATAATVVVNAGIGGAFAGGPRVGEAVLVVRETLAGLGREDGEPLTLPPGAGLVAGVDAHAGLVDRCSALGLRTAAGLTVSQVTTSDATARRLSERYGCDIETMEGFAVLRAAALAAVPALEVRGVSNYVGERERGAWDFRAGARAAVAALERILAGPLG